MKKSTKILVGVLAVLLVLVFSLINGYNSLVATANAVDAQWANVDTVLQRRFDLIPNLVNSVKGIMAQEEKVFSDIANARARLAGAAEQNETVAASGELNSAISRLLVVMENYPELRSIESTTALMDELSGSENRISTERGRYNTAVQSYNNKIMRFPTNILASMFGYSPRAYFEKDNAAAEAPKVEF